MFQMPKMEMEWKLTPQFFVSAANFCAIIIAAVGAYVTLSNDVKADKLTIQSLQTQIGKLEAKDDSTVGLIQQIQIGFGTRLVKLESDTSYIKEGVARIEQLQRQTR